MSKFKPGDRVRHTWVRSATATILAVHEGRYWVEYDDGVDGPITVTFEYLDLSYELIPESFLTDGDTYCIVYANGVVSAAFSSLATAESVYRGSVGRGIIRIDGQTGALSWAKGGPERSQNGNER